MAPLPDPRPMSAPAKLQGPFSIMSVADLIQWARTAQKSGNLVLREDGRHEIQVVFLDGRIVYSSNARPHQTYSSYLVELGICKEADVNWAMRREIETGIMYAAVLVSAGRLDERLATATLKQKTIEDLCDVFLWRDGGFEFFPSPFQGRQFLPIDVDPVLVVAEGVARREVWARLSTRIPGYAVFEPTPGPPARLTWSDAAITECVLGRLDGVKTVDDLVEELPFGRFKIYLAIEELLSGRRITSGDATAAGQRRERRSRLLNEARAAEREGRWGEAIQMLEELSARYPGDDDVMAELVNALDAFRRYVNGHSFGFDDVPVVIVGDAIRRLALDPASGFVLSRIDGQLTVQQILKISPVKEVEGLRILKRLLDAKVIDFPRRALVPPTLRPRPA